MSQFFTNQNYRRAAAVTTSDTADNSCMAIYVGGAGNVTVITEGGDTVTFTAPPVGSIIPVRCTIIKATGTTATLLVRLW
jgi:hypothetical protein